LYTQLRQCYLAKIDQKEQSTGLSFQDHLEQLRTVMEALRHTDALETNRCSTWLDNLLQAVLCLTIIGALIKFYYTEDKQHKAYYGFFDRTIRSEANHMLEILRQDISTLPTPR
jgi:hypothetical protein